MIEFPHVKYMSSQQNHNPDRVVLRCQLNKTDLMKQKFLGENVNLTDGKVYEFRWVFYSPDPSTERRDVLATTDDEGKIIGLEENKNFFVNLRKKQQ